jgi:hypothetical protein
MEKSLERRVFFFSGVSFFLFFLPGQGGDVWFVDEVN